MLYIITIFNKIVVDNRISIGYRTGYVRFGKELQGGRSEAVVVEPLLFGRISMKTVKFQADLASTDELVLNTLMEELEVRSKADFLAKALALMNWAVKEKKRGHRIVTIDEQGEVIRELITPELERIAPDFDLPSICTTWTLQEVESFGKLASESQPKPASHLIRAMNRR